MGTELMVSVASPNSVISAITLAFLADIGWY